MKCIKCGITIPELPEDATMEEMLCNRCYEIHECTINGTHLATVDRDGYCNSCGFQET